MEFLLKSVLICAVLYFFYKVFLQKETFFQSIRGYFIIGAIGSVILPLVTIPIYIEVTPIVMTEIMENISPIKELINVEPASKLPIQKETFNWLGLLGLVYIIGVFFFTIKFTIDLFSLAYLLFYGNKKKLGAIVFVETDKELAPFSFFNFIVYNKNQFTQLELRDIIAHEKVHVNQKHSLDILLIQLLTILQWFNPFVWLFKKETQKNLEYIADKIAQEKAETNKKYQYLLLKTSVANNSFALSNNFFNSHLKQRIIMLQKSQTKKLNQVKYLLLIPLIAVFLYSFNAKEVFIPNKSDFILKESVNKNEIPPFVNPIYKENVIAVSSGFGRRIDPKTNKIKFHSGIDIKAYKDVDVYATADGLVIKTAFDKLKGNYIQIEHANNYQTNYHHLGEIQVAVNEQVKAGEIISTVGVSGKSTNPHLHYEIMKDGKNRDPKLFVDYDTIKKQAKYGVRSTSTKYKTIANKFTGYNVIINSKTSKKELKRIQNKFKKEHNITIKFYDIKRNTDKEIIAIKVDANSENSASSYSYAQNIPIAKIIIAYDKDNDEIFIENVGVKNPIKSIKKNHTIGNAIKTVRSNGDKEISHSSKSFEQYIVNGKKVTKKEYEKMDKSKIKSLSITKENTTTITKGDKVGSLNLNNSSYYYTTKNGITTFHDKFGNNVAKKLAIKLQKKLDKQ